MLQLILKLHVLLSQIKGFDNVGYSNQSTPEGYMILDYNGKRYAVKLVEIKNPSLDPHKDIDRVRYHF